MGGAPSSSHAHRSVCLAALSALLAAGCAGTSPRRDTVAEPAGREAPRQVMGATTPAAATPQGGGPGARAAGSDDTTRPGRLLIYSAITGHTPLRDKANDPADRYRSPAEREAARARSIEAEIEEELARQEELGVDEQSRHQASGANAPAPPAQPDADAGELSAPAAPTLKKLPDRLFSEEEVAIPPGTWQNQETLYVVRRSLDVDADGNPEELRYVDSSTGKLVRSEQDLDYDGQLDAWITYRDGEPVVRVLDANGDGRSDAWERYGDGVMNARALDRDADGVRDTFYKYEGDDLATKTYDENNDGTIDRQEKFEGQRRVNSEEDRSKNGSIDTWTTYGVVDGREVVTRIERDSRDRGKPDVFETYETRDGDTRLTRREEDVNGDGSVDVVSIYEDGKLVQRAISDEALSPL